MFTAPGWLPSFQALFCALMQIFQPLRIESAYSSLFEHGSKQCHHIWKKKPFFFPPPQNSFKLNLENASSTFPPSFLPSVASSSFLMLASDAGWKAFSNYKLNFIKEVVEASTAEHKCPPASIFYIHTHTVGFYGKYGQLRSQFWSFSVKFWFYLT